MADGFTEQQLMHDPVARKILVRYEKAPREFDTRAFELSRGSPKQRTSDPPTLQSIHRDADRKD